MAVAWCHEAHFAAVSTVSCCSWVRCSRGIDAVDCSSASSLLSLSMTGCNPAARVMGADRMAHRNCRRLYAPVSNLDRRATSSRCWTCACFGSWMFNPPLRMRATSYIWSAVAACRCDKKEHAFGCVVQVLLDS